MRVSIPRWLIYIVVFLAVYAAVSDLYRLLRPFYSPGWERVSFYDFRLWREGVERYANTGVLYDTDTPGFFLAGSHANYKYPPTYAALLKPFVGVEQRIVGRAFFLGNLVALLASAALILRELRVRRRLAIVSLGIFILWKPTWETLSDLQMESLILLALVTSFVLLRRNRQFLAGLGIGVAGAFKVYPWALLPLFAARRRWGVVLGGIAGAFVTLSLASFVIPVSVFIEYFSRILPRLGGISLSWENVSLFGFFGRLGVAAMEGMPSPEVLDEMYLDAGHLSMGGLLGTSVLVAFVLGSLLVWKKLVGSRSVTSAAPDFDLCVWVCILLSLIPTSWLSYQTLLILPVLVCLDQVTKQKRKAWQWGLMGFVVAIGLLLYGYDEAFGKYPALYSTARCLLPMSAVALLYSIRFSERDRPCLQS